MYKPRDTFAYLSGIGISTSMIRSCKKLHQNIQTKVPNFRKFALTKNRSSLAYGNNRSPLYWSRKNFTHGSGSTDTPAEHYVLHMFKRLQDNLRLYDIWRFMFCNLHYDDIIDVHLEHQVRRNRGSIHLRERKWIRGTNPTFNIEANKNKVNLKTCGGLGLQRSYWKKYAIWSTTRWRVKEYLLVITFLYGKKTFVLINLIHKMCIFI